MKTISIHVQKTRQGYEAWINRTEGPYAGESPDEALGYAIRELWLWAGSSASVLKLRITMDT